jgi:hypothetical protein
MANDDLVSLSIELEELIRAQYAPEVQSVVQAILLSYGTDRSQQAVDRVRFDLLYLGNGDVSRLQQLAILAKQDARDVMSQEYFRIDGQTYPHPWARRHLVNRDKAYPPKQGAAILTTAKLIVRRQSSGSNKMLDRLSTSSKPHLLPSLFLTFSNANQLLELADQMQALAESSDVLDLSSSLQYRGCLHSPARTVLHRTHGTEAETLVFEDNLLSWYGNAEYWTECSRRCVDLGKTAGYQFLMHGTADQQVKVSFSPA